MAPPRLYVYLFLFVTFKSRNVVECSDNSVTPNPPNITRMSVSSIIYARFATVTVRSVLTNDAKECRLGMFSVQIPESAFISNLTMTIDNKVLQGIVQEKSTAQKTFDDAKEAGASAGLVSHKSRNPSRGMDIFSTSMNVPANSSIIFELTYQELIERELGEFVQRINVQPFQIIKDLQISVVVKDPQNVKWFGYSLPNKTNVYESSHTSALVKASLKQREVVYKPSTKEQQAYDPLKGIHGDFIVRYIIEGSTSDRGGIALVDNGYFVHFFSVENQPVIPKNIVFVIDVSGSMSGFKIEKVRDVMLDILGSLPADNYFNLLVFNHGVKFWKSEPMPATRENIYFARRFAEDVLKASGSTNINEALLNGIESLMVTQSLVGNRGNILVFLTDGLPTADETNTTKIRENVKQKNKKRDGYRIVSIYALGFGYDVDMPFLNYLALENGGFAKRIYVEADAFEQLTTFYQRIKSPLLLNLDMTYNPNKVLIEELTKNKFSQYNNGSELVIAGKLKEDPNEKWTGTVSAIAKDENVEYTVTPFDPTQSNDYRTNFNENFWAYLKIKDLLNEEALSEDESRKEYLKEKALNMSLTYNFVTPLTSMVVTEQVHVADKDSRISMGRRHNVKMSTHGGSISYANDINDAIENLPVFILLIASCLFSIWFQK